MFAPRVRSVVVWLASSELAATGGRRPHPPVPSCYLISYVYLFGLPPDNIIYQTKLPSQLFTILIEHMLVFEVPYCLRDSLYLRPASSSTETNLRPGSQAPTTGS